MITREEKRRQDPKRIEYMREYRKQWRKNNKEKISEYNKIRYANDEIVRLKQKARTSSRGRIAKADRCENCGLDYPLEAHHADHTKPLEVKWLCIYCHRWEK